MGKLVEVPLMLVGIGVVAVYVVISSGCVEKKAMCIRPAPMARYPTANRATDIFLRSLLFVIVMVDIRDVIAIVIHAKNPSCM